jgi:hypothetical protein
MPKACPRSATSGATLSAAAVNIMFATSPLLISPMCRTAPPNNRTWCPLHNWHRISAGNLPNYSFITPNGCDDAHDCGLSTADNWLKNNIDPLIKNSVFQKDGLLIVVFDESRNANTNGGGRVVCTLISPVFSKLGYQSTTIYQHESMLRLTLEGSGVTVLSGAASVAPAMWGFFTL